MAGAEDVKTGSVIVMILALSGVTKVVVDIQLAEREP
jgi:hypothetical protein